MLTFCKARTAVLEHDTLEISKVDYTSDAQQNMKAIAQSAITLMDNNDVVYNDSRCRHTGGHGSRYHQGNGYCHWCTICNPSNPKAY